ncbi:MAG: alpha/beta hydrolase fold [Alphaproteobacteria bacterium]|nr:alpha/beta hydrolase fold [Alphaproteobacteria bacterium]
MLFWTIRIGMGLAVLILTGLIGERIAEAIDARRLPPPGTMVGISGGRSLHLLCEGDAAAPAMVVEQGAGEPAILWRALQKKAAGFSHFCLYDRAGYGWSPPAPAFQTVEERAADLHDLLKAAGVKGPYILVAHSYGGLVVRAFSRAYPRETAGIVMVDAIEESIAFHPDYLRFIRQSRPIVAAMRAAAALGIMRLVGAFSRGDHEGGAVSREDERLAAAITARPSFFTAIAGDLKSIEAAAATPSNALPTGMGSLGDLPVVAITHGKPFPGPFARLEPFWLPGQKRMVSLSSRGRLITAEKSNHMVHQDQPDLVLAALRSVVEDAGRRPRP